jgi:hypothetical protein
MECAFGIGRWNRRNYHLILRMGKLLSWFARSNRWKHLAYGAAVGFCADDIYCAVYVGVGVASALEYKDRSWGGKWDWADWGLTVIGVSVGFGIRTLLIKII